MSWIRKCVHNNNANYRKAKSVLQVFFRNTLKLRLQCPIVIDRGGFPMNSHYERLHQDGGTDDHQSGAESGVTQSISMARVAYETHMLFQPTPEDLVNPDLYRVNDEWFEELEQRAKAIHQAVASLATN